MPFPKRKKAGLKSKYRSGLEDEIAKQLQGAGVPCEYESLKIEYTVPASKHTYTPDFPLPNGIIIETKGELDLDDRKKHLHIKEQHPHLDIRFVFDRSKARIYKGSPTTYGMWCEKNGFLYADKKIPIEWLKEQPKRRSK